MWVDSAVLRAHLIRLEREAGEEFDESEDSLLSQAFFSGKITAYHKIEKILDEWGED
jgi:hypothetical protein